MTAPEKLISIQALMDSSGVRFGTSGVRGLVAEMSPELCFAYTLAFLHVMGVTRGMRLAVAMDLRPSSAPIAATCTAMARHVGVDVEFCGAIPTPALAYYTQTQAIAGMMVTGRHIPFDRNGIKFYSAQGEITKAHEVAISNAVVSVPRYLPINLLPVLNPAAAQLYMDRYVDFFPANSLAGMRLGFYQHSSVAREILVNILKALGAEVISLGRTDEFVPIDTEAVAEADIRQARSWATEFGFDAILTTDGDADRPLIGDEHGLWMRGDIVGMLCAQYLGAQNVVAPISCNSAIESSGAFNNVTRSRIGSPYVIEKMEQMISSWLPNVVGFEANGGFLLGSAIEKNGRTLAPLLTRDAVLPLLALLVMAKQKACKVSELARDLPARFTASDRLQSVAPETSRQLLQDLVASNSAIDNLLGGIAGQPIRLDQTDGLRIFMEQGEIVHFRPSGNAPELRCYTEAESQERAEWLAHACLRRVHEAYKSVA